jgi:glycosyltransferase involved in cell wall biosynthesis
MHYPAVSIVIPAYNEEQTIGKIIEGTLAIMDSLQVPYEIIVVDDGSTDNTRQVATQYKATVLVNGRNRGKGYAIRKGFRHTRGEIIVTIDSDGSHSPKEIPELINPLFNGTDIVSGSRFLGTGRYSTTRLNRLGNSLFNIVIMTLTRKHITDSQTGFRALKKQVIDKLNLNSTGYDIETEITVKGLRNGFTFQEKPISCQRREHDFSKIRILADGTRIFKAILKANASRIEHQPTQPLRIA